MAIIDHPSWVRAIRDGVAAMHEAHASRGRYDSHDLINWLNVNRNMIVNEIIDSCRTTAEGVPAGDPVLIATRQIGEFLQDLMGQIREGKQRSAREITLTDGSDRNGECEVSVWGIGPSTAPGSLRDLAALFEGPRPAQGPSPAATSTVQPRDEWERRLLGMATDCGVSLPDSALSSDELYES